MANRPLPATGPTASLIDDAQARCDAATGVDFTLAGPSAEGPAPRAFMAPQVSERLLEQRLLRQLFELGATTQSAAFIVAVFAALVFYLLTDRPDVLWWSLLIHSAQSLRWAFMRQNARIYPAPTYSMAQPAGAWRYVFPLGLTGLAWGAAAWMLMPPGAFNPNHSAVLVVLLFGMVAGSVPAVAPWPPAVAAWMGTITLGMASRFAWQGGTEGWILCACAVLFGVVMSRFALVQRRLLAEGLRAQLQNEALSEQLMNQSVDLQRLGRERNRFFASASHDLRQPVHALALFSQALRRDLQGHASLPVAERVVEATDAVSNLLSAMLDISRINAGVVRAEIAPVAVDQIFLRLAQIYDNRAHEAGLALRFHLAPTVLHTDGELVFRILSNFVDNAIKYSDGPVRPDGAPRAVLVSARQRGERLRLAVWDRGRGIAPEHAPLVFDEFYQVDNAHRDTARGLGIGLAIVRRLAALLGGAVGLRSQPGRGSVFWLDIPHARQARGAGGVVPATGQPDADAPKRAARAAPPAAPAALRPPRVLLLDDDFAVGEAMRIWLQPHCEAIDITQSLVAAQAALARAGARGFDVFVVDFRLPGEVNGIEATQALRAAAGREVPTILVTGDTDPARVRAALDSGLQVLFKPVQPAHLLETLYALTPLAAAAPASQSTR